MKVSIIVPTYNVEKYIRKCLDSLIQQDYDNFDVFVINDGSPANEQVIINEYQKNYPNLIKGIKKENGGYGSVLERGFRESDADCILICDPDDYLDPSCVSTLVKDMQESGADLVVGAKNLVFSDNDEIKYDPSFNSEFGTLIDHQVYTKGSKEFRQLYFLEPSPHAKLYRREMVLNIEFPHRVSYTDNLLYFYVLNQCSKVMYEEKPLSYYLINREGNTRTDLKPGVIDAWVKVYSSILNQVSNAEDIFYYRMYEAFKFITYKVDQIKGDQAVKREKLESTSCLLEALIPHRAAIEMIGREYQNFTRSDKMLLNPMLSSFFFRRMVTKRLKKNYITLKHRIRLFVTKNPVIDGWYQKYHERMKYKVHENDEKIELHPQVELKKLGSDQTCFFGYYDKAAVRNNHVLYHEVQSDSLDICQEVLIKVDDTVIGSTKSWNWQQGAMASWLNDDEIIFNVYQQGYKAKIVNIHTKEERLICAPVYSVSKDGTFALSLNFSRLAKLRPDYGYFNESTDELMKCDENDGLFIINLTENTCSLLVSLKTISEFCPKETMRNAWHKVNHVDLAPDSSKAVFLHRWYQNEVKYTRLMCIDLHTNELSVLADYDMVSHMGWIDSEHLVGYLRGKDGKDGFYFVDLDGSMRSIPLDELKDDGHPTVHGKYMVCDSYPDHTCKSKLYLVNLENQKIITLGKFHSYYQYQGTVRCDLHPRFNADGTSVTFDSVCDGKRNIYLLDFNKLV